MIALRFTLFSDKDLELMESRLEPLLDTATAAGNENRERRERISRGIHGHPSHEVNAEAALCKEIAHAIRCICNQCRKARYFYLKGDLLQDSPNLEIESDKLRVESFLAKLGFSDDMIGALNAAEVEYKKASNQFELKNSLDHLRSFLEHLHREAAKAVALAAGGTVIDAWGNATSYLKTKQLFTQKHEEFITRLYTLISDQGVHALGAEPEYARLLRNMVIEYGLMFLTVLDKKGITITP